MINTFQFVCSNDLAAACWDAMAASKWYAETSNGSVDSSINSKPLLIKDRFHLLLSWCFNNMMLLLSSSLASSLDAWKHISANRALARGKAVSEFCVSIKHKRIASSQRSSRISLSGFEDLYPSLNKR